MIMRLINETKTHLIDTNTNYFKHLVFAFKAGILSILAGISLIIHAVLPCFFQHTGSNFIKFLAKLFEKRSRIDDT